MAWVRVANDDVTLRVRIEGARDGGAVVLLHGWPDTSTLWDEVAADLLEAGYLVVVPDLRGCGASDKPRDVASYAMAHLVEDVLAVVAALGEYGVERVTLVGHDWGASLAWVVASRRPDLVERLVVVSVGHPTAFRSGGLEQQIKSWYTLLFYHEGVGEAFLRKNDYEALRHWSGHPRVEDVIRELERDGQMTTHLLWYRANIGPDAFVTDPPTLAPLRVAVLGLWSSGDFALSERQMTNSALYCEAGFTYQRLEGYGHWIPLEAPHELSRAIIEFCATSDVGRGPNDELLEQ
ncbi:MAG: alpha/beta fold hydrolase [Acidimicrobiales bacterium]